MDFISRLSRAPRAFDAERGAETLATLPGLAPELEELIKGAGGCSPYLKMLVEKEAGWIAPAFDAPEEAIEDVFRDLRSCAADDLARALRQAKRRVALMAGLADLGGVWPLETVTGILTRFADLACHLALQAAIGGEIKRGKLPGVEEGDLAQAGGMVVLAMGKMGARELNYSSDIDLICLFDETRFNVDDFHEARAGFVRATKKMAAMLGDITAEGYVFRTDLRLRPDPAVTPVCIAMEAAERYYESLGRTWERAAYIKARPAAGDLAAGDRFLTALTPFVWRKHLDFAAIQDAHDMRLRIREHKGLGGAIVLEGHNMKLGRGGIREIEFFTQTRQIIAGGRDPELRLRGTTEALEVLAQKGWVTPAAAQTLAGHYRWHREVEHRLQMVNDEQTHSLPKSAAGLQRLACFMGLDLADLRRELAGRLSEVHDITEGFFAPDAVAPAEQSEFDADIIARWHSYPALRSARAMEIFKRLKPEVLSRLKNAARPNEALLAFDGFLAGLPAGVQLFSLFEANTQLIDLLVDIVGTSPALAGYLSRNSKVFDAVIGGDFFAPWPGAAALTVELMAHLAREEDYEHKLDASRRWAKEWHFRIGVHHLRGLIDATQAGAQYADLAEASIAGLMNEVVAQFSRKHGAPPGRGAVVLGMGSLGAARLHSASDLDLIVIYDAGGVEASEGKRPLSSRPYYARLTQALVTAVTAPMAEGRVYEVDMRLRPSGSQGPVATSLDSFRDYQTNEAWVWEHLALTRARVIAGETSLAADVESFRGALLAQPKDRAKVLAQTAEMRARIASAKAPKGVWDVKLGPGRLQDIELLSQAAALLAGSAARFVAEGLAAGVAIGWLSAADEAVLSRAYTICWQVRTSTKLLTGKPLDPENIGVGGCAMLLRETGQDDLEALQQALVDDCAAAAEVIAAALGVSQEGGEP